VKLSSRLSYANVMATIAVFIALGGGAYALNLGRNAVKTRNIAPNAVKSKKIAPDAVRGSDVRESSLGTVPDAAKLGGTGPGGYVQGLNSIQRVRQESVPLSSSGVSFQIAGVGSVQFTSCTMPTAGQGGGTFVFHNTTSGSEQIWRKKRFGTTNSFDEVTLAGGLAQLDSLPNVANVYEEELQIGSGSAVTQIKFDWIYDSFASLCRYTLWTSKTEQEQG
jgi:hypothetical protein